MYQKGKKKIDISFWANYIKRGPGYKEDKTIYKFDYMEDWVKEWKCEHITKNMIQMLPYDILIFADLTDSGYMKDHYGNDIKDMEEWSRQRSLYVDYLYNKYKR